MKWRAIAVPVVLIASAFVAVSAHAQTPAPKTGRGISFFTDLSLYSASLRSDSTGRQARGLGFGVALGLAAVNGIFQVGVGIGGQWGGDPDPFTNETTDGTMESSLLVAGESIFAGLHSPGITVGRNLGLKLGVNFGRSWAGGSRSISNCDGCNKEDFEIRGGMYYEPTLSISILKRLDGRYTLGGFLSFRRYVPESELQSAVLVGCRVVGSLW